MNTAKSQGRFILDGNGRQQPEVDLGTPRSDSASWRKVLNALRMPFSRMQQSATLCRHLQPVPILGAPVPASLKEKVGLIFQYALHVSCKTADNSAVSGK